ncbi:MAG TPA: lysoplasmalogenase [Pseudohaliea sp.]|nr:lysoplasmalogenase [Pseudohaliea sp.]
MTVRRALEALFLFAAVAFVVAPGAGPGPVPLMLKVTPIACLAALVLLQRGAARGPVLGALAFSAVGDLSLELGAFAPGLGAFLLAHLCYIAAFAARPRFSAGGVLLALLLSAFATGLGTLLMPEAGTLAPAVLAYLAVITAMALVATFCGAGPWAVAGAVAFVLSDALIAVNRFLEPVPGARHAIMLLYYAAQFGLTARARGWPAGR